MTFRDLTIIVLISFVTMVFSLGCQTGTWPCSNAVHPQCGVGYAAPYSGSQYAAPSSYVGPYAVPPASISSNLPQQPYDAPISPNDRSGAAPIYTTPNSTPSISVPNLTSPATQPNGRTNTLDLAPPPADNGFSTGYGAR